MNLIRSLGRKIYPSFFLLLLAVSCVCTLCSVLLIRDFLRQQVGLQLETHAGLVRNLLENRLNRDVGQLDAWCRNAARGLNIRITVILASGHVVGDSDAVAAAMDNHADRPEISGAISEGIGSSTRYSYTLKQDMMYVAVPVRRNGKVWGVVRAAASVASVRHLLAPEYRKIVYYGIAVVLFSVLVGCILSSRIARPLEALRQGLLRLQKEGDLRYRLRITGLPEIVAVAEAVNQITARCTDRLDEVTEQLREFESIFSSMIEAVIVIDPEGRVIRANRAAARLFGFTPEAAVRRDLQELVRHVDVQQFMETTLNSGAPVEGVITLRGGGKKILRVHGSLLRSGTGRAAGALFVFHNITRLKQLENMRREFVANVSHELRTPITAISGFVETLRNGAMHDPENAVRFLEIIARNVKRLYAIIEDLLSLSQIEQGEQQGCIPLAWGSVRAVLEDAAVVCRNSERGKNIQIRLECDAALRAEINADLLGQAVINLLDNAIKYSKTESMVTVRAEQKADEVVIAVEDSGCGIAREHLPRLFERFYRVDKARSCKLGGTGLGLAITKHIILAHQGTISVDSTPGKGSTFFIRLPRRR
ncbi:MAG: ATP-binding protein [Candidatus Electrothrix sp. YB6]